MMTAGRGGGGAMIGFLSLSLAMLLVVDLPGASSFVVPAGRGRTPASLRISDPRASPPKRVGKLRARTLIAMADPASAGTAGVRQHAWSPQDLTRDVPGRSPIPDDDYVKKYQRNPELWPVEFFLIAYRRRPTRDDDGTQQAGRGEAQVLVRESANGTSQWGLGTGVPATRWVLSAEDGGRPPPGYEWSKPPNYFEAKNFPEFPKDGQESWTYAKIDIREDALNGPDGKFKDSELEEYAEKIRESLRTKLEQMSDCKNVDPWEASTIAVVKSIVDNTNSRAAIQGTLRMSGLFARKKTGAAAADDAPSRSRYVGLGGDAPDPAELAQSMRIYTMFPQMPDPMPSPSTPPEELRKEIASRDSRMTASGRDPHEDRHGRTFTHRSTSNVSNTIHGVYLTLDATGLPGLDEVPALDLFGTREVKREWKSLQDLKVLDADGKSISTEDTKPTFISGFIVRQLVKEGVIDVGTPC